jgi:sRNA-binding protein
MSLDISRQSETNWDAPQSEDCMVHDSFEALKSAVKQPTGTWRRLQATALAASRFARQAQAAAADRMQEAEHLAAQVHRTSSIIPIQKVM